MLIKLSWMSFLKPASGLYLVFNCWHNRFAYGQLIKGFFRKDAES